MINPDALTKDAIPSANRLEQEFDRIKKKRKGPTVDLNQVKDSIEKNIYIRSKDTSEETNKQDYTVNKMTTMGKKTHTVLHSMYPELSHTKKKKKESNFRKGLSGLSAMTLGALAMPSVISTFSKPVESVKKRVSTLTNRKKFDNENIFGLKDTDKIALKKMKDSINKDGDKMAKLVKLVGASTFPGIAGLIFGFKIAKDSVVHKAFREQLSKYQNNTVKVFTEIFNTLYNWINDNIVSNFLVSPKKINSIRLKALNVITLLMNSERGNESVNIDKVQDAGLTIAGTLKEIVYTFLGSKDAAAVKGSATYDDRGFLQKIKEKMSEFSEDIFTPGDENITQEGGEFQGLPQGSSLGTAKGMLIAVYSGLRKAGFNDNQSRLLAAEIGREGSLKPSNVFGYHKDPRRGVNLGMISWQGSRGRALEKWMSAAGLINPAGGLVASQASIDMQAKFIMHEILTDPRYARTKKQFLGNPNIGYEEAGEVLGNNYIVWCYDESRYGAVSRSGKRNRAVFYKKLNSELSAQNAAKSNASGTGDMVWPDLPNYSEASKEIEYANSYKPQEPSSLYISRHEYRKPEIASAYIPLPIATHIIPEINTNNISNKKNTKRINITSNYTQSSFVGAATQVNTVDSSTPRAQSHQPSQPSSKSQNSDSSFSSKVSGSCSIPRIISFYEELLQKDRDGNMN